MTRNDYIHSLLAITNGISAQVAAFQQLRDNAPEELWDEVMDHTLAEIMYETEYQWEAIWEEHGPVVMLGTCERSLGQLLAGS